MTNEITKKCICLKTDNRTPKICNLKLLQIEKNVFYEKYDDYYADIYTEYKGYCVYVGGMPFNSFQKYKKELENISNDVINHLRGIFPNNCIIELFKLTNEEDLLLEFSQRREQILKIKVEEKEKEKEKEREKEKQEQIKRDAFLLQAKDDWQGNKEITNKQLEVLCSYYNIKIPSRTLSIIRNSLITVKADREEISYKKILGKNYKFYTPSMEGVYDVICNLLNTNE